MASNNPLDDPVWMNWLRLLGMVAVSVIGIVMLFGVVPLLLDDLASGNWPPAAMTVTDIVREHEAGRPPHFNVYIDYSLSVEQLEFLAKHRLVDTDVISSNLDPIMQQYAVGTKHTIYKSRFQNCR